MFMARFSYIGACIMDIERFCYFDFFLASDCDLSLCFISACCVLMMICNDDLCCFVL